MRVRRAAGCRRRSGDRWRCLVLSCCRACWLDRAARLVSVPSCDCAWASASENDELPAPSLRARCCSVAGGRGATAAGRLGQRSRICQLLLPLHDLVDLTDRVGKAHTWLVIDGFELILERVGRQMLAGERRVNRRSAAGRFHRSGSVLCCAPPGRARLRRRPSRHTRRRSLPAARMREHSHEPRKRSGLGCGSFPLTLNCPGEPICDIEVVPNPPIGPSAAG